MLNVADFGSFIIIIIFLFFFFSLILPRSLSFYSLWMWKEGLSWLIYFCNIGSVSVESFRLIIYIPLSRPETILFIILSTVFLYIFKVIRIRWKLRHAQFQATLNIFFFCALFMVEILPVSKFTDESFSEMKKKRYERTKFKKRKPITSVHYQRNWIQNHWGKNDFDAINWLVQCKRISLNYFNFIVNQTLEISIETPARLADFTQSQSKIHKMDRK